MTKAQRIFNFGLNNDRLNVMLTEIVLDDRWHKPYKHQNHELVGHAIQWTKRAHEDSGEIATALDVLNVAQRVLRWCSR